MTCTVIGFKQTLLELLISSSVLEEKWVWSIRLVRFSFVPYLYCLSTLWAKILRSAQRWIYHGDHVVLGYSNSRYDVVMTFSLAIIVAKLFFEFFFEASIDTFFCDCRTSQDGQFFLWIDLWSIWLPIMSSSSKGKEIHRKDLKSVKAVIKDDLTTNPDDQVIVYIN